jgi:gas vesicle protein
MSENNGGAADVAFFLAGLGIGAVLALLFAPASGEETREFIAHKSEEGKSFLAAKSRELREQAEELVERSKELAARQKELVAATLDAYKQGYEEAKSKGR